MNLTKQLLQTALSASVPLWIEQFRGLNHESRMEHVRGVVDLLCEHGDLLLYRASVGRKEKSADVFNALAKSIAVMAFQPGGVTSFGLHFEEKGVE